MIFPPLIMQLELTAHTGFLELPFLLIEFREVSEITGTRFVATFENSGHRSLFP